MDVDNSEGGIGAEGRLVNSELLDRLRIDRKDKLFEDYPPILPPYPSPQWSVWPTVDQNQQIPPNARPMFSHLYEFPAPRSHASIQLDIFGTNIIIWRWVGVARNAYGSPGRPDGPYAPCPGTSECPIGWANFGNPRSEPVGPAEVYAEVDFSHNSHDYPRYAYWVALVSRD